MKPPLNLRDLIARIEALPAPSRRIIALAGPPGSGKSTTADALCEELNTKRPNQAAVLPMDGFHLDDWLLRARGLLERKGAPETFDVAGLKHMLGRIRQNVEPEIIVPVFDRSIEIARAGARSISRSTSIIIVEGNYLLLSRLPWLALRSYFDLSVMIETSLEILTERLMARWRGMGFDEAASMQKLQTNDLPNARTTLEKSQSPDMYI